MPFIKLNLPADAGPIYLDVGRILSWQAYGEPARAKIHFDDGSDFAAYVEVTESVEEVAQKVAIAFGS